MSDEIEPIDRLLRMEERQLIERITDIQREAAMTAKPYVDRLVKLRSLRTEPFVLSYSDAVKRGLVVPEE